MAPPQVIIQTRIVSPCATITLSGTLLADIPTKTAHAARETATRVPSTVFPSPISTANVTPTRLPITVYMAPGDARDDVYARFAEMLAKSLRQRVVCVVPDSYAASIKALCSGEADVAWLATPDYLTAHRECAARAEYTVERDGWGYSQAQILVQSNERRAQKGLDPINSLQDLVGKSIALTNEHSPTGYLFPKATLADAGILVSQELLVAGDGQVALAVYRGEVDAGATFWRPLRLDGSIGDARVSLLREYPDAVDALRVLRLSPPIPNDPLVLRSDLDPETRARLIAGLGDFSRSAEGRELLDTMYGLTGLSLVSDADYDIVRQMVTSLGLDPQEMLR